MLQSSGNGEQGCSRLHDIRAVGDNRKVNSVIDTIIIDSPLPVELL